MHWPVWRTKRSTPLWFPTMCSTSSIRSHFHGKALWCERKDLFQYPNKYYYTDIGLRNADWTIVNTIPATLWKTSSTTNFCSRGYSVDVGVVTDRTGGANTQKEIDFVVNDADKKIYIQSAFQMDADKKESSELASLILTKDFFKKSSFAWISLITSMMTTESSIAIWLTCCLVV